MNGDFRRKSPIFSTQCIYSPRWRGSPWNWVSAQGSEETRMMGLPERWKGFMIRLAVLIQYRRVTYIQPPSEPRCHSKHRAMLRVAQIKSRNFWYFVCRVKFRVAKRTHMPLGCAKFHVNRCNESPLRGENADFGPVRKYRQFAASRHPAGNKHRNTTFSHLQPARVVRSAPNYAWW